MGEMNMIKIPNKMILDRDIDSLSFALFCHLLIVYKSENKRKLTINYHVLKGLLQINDNRTLKRSLQIINDIGIIKTEIETLKRNAHLNVEFQEDSFIELETFESLSIHEDRLKYLLSFGHKYSKLLCYSELSTTNFKSDQKYLMTYRVMENHVGVAKSRICEYVKELRKLGVYQEFEKRLQGHNEDSLIIGSFTTNDNLAVSNLLNYNVNKKLSESDLENILCKDLSVIESGMQLIQNQLKVKDGFIDILAKDSTGRLCIIEIKVVSNDERILFQSLYYPTQILGNPRMITIAPNYEDKIKYSLQQLGYVEMKTYTYENDQLTIQDIN